MKKQKVTHIKQGYMLAVMANAYDWKHLAELGVRKGGTAELILRYAPGVSYTGIDAWTPIKGDPSEPGFTDYGKPDMRQWKATAEDRLKQFHPRGVLVHADSVEAAKRFDPGTFDCVFIDADHRFDAVLADIRAWTPLIRSGGWVTGHDWEWPSVRKAVQMSFDAPIVLAPNCWGVQV